MKMKQLLVIAVLFIGSLASAQVQFWGLTSKGGDEDLGTIFKTNANGSIITTQYSFKEENNGSKPAYCDLLLANNGKLYGTLSDGGINNFGVLFEYNPVNDSYTVLHHFNNTGDGKNPQSSLIQASNGKIYGVTMQGGNANSGIIFEYNLTTNSYSKIFDFEVGNQLKHPKQGLVEGSNGKLYGTCNNQVNPGDPIGSIFQFDPTSNTITGGANFSFTNGSFPNSLLIEMAPGIYYGTTLNGGTNDMGIIYEYNSTTNVITAKYQLDNFNFQYNSDGIFLAKNTNDELIGTSAFGGMNNKGFIFKYLRSTNTLTTAYDFDNGATSNPKSRLYKATDGSFYGLTVGTGIPAQTVYKFNPTTNNYNHLIELQINDGSGALCGMTQDSNGKIYGMQTTGGIGTEGTLYQFDPVTLVYDVKLNFNTKDGNTPKESLFEASNGKLYGVTYGGGAQYGESISNNYGTIFEYDPNTDTYKKIRNLQFSSGTNPSTTFMEASNGKIYGVSSLGGFLNGGVLFELNISNGVTTVKHEFINAEGINPMGKLVEVGNELFGMTQNQGGSGVQGTIYKYNYSTNTFSVVKTFTGTDGANPNSTLILASDGNLYGTTENGGNSSLGVSFQFNPTTNGYAIGKHFNGVDGAHPRAGMIERPDFLIGTTSEGGTNDFGVIYEISLLNGSFVKTYDFNGTNGKYPEGEFMLAPNGITYAMTKKGGANDKGVLYRYNYSNNAFAVQSTFDGTNGAEPMGGLIHSFYCAPTASTDSISSCDPIVWLDGNTYNNSTGTINIPTFTTLNVAGCDSVITLHYIRKDISFGNDYQVHCGSYQWMDGVTYTNSTNTPTFTLTNSQGCDSIVTLDLTITTEVAGIDNQVQCGSYTWIDGVTYTATTYSPQHTITLPSGCDSIVTLHLDIVNFQTRYDTIVTCGEYTWINGTTYTQSIDNEIFNIQAPGSCDTIAHLNLTIAPYSAIITNNSGTLECNVNADTYQWIDCATQQDINGETNATFTPTQHGEYAVVTELGTCTEISNCIEVTDIGLGLAEQFSSSIFAIHPNPSDGIFIIQTNSKHSFAVVIRNAIGQEIRSIGTSSNKLIIDINNEAKGFYFIEIQQNGKSIIKKISKI